MYNSLYLVFTFKGIMVQMRQHFIITRKIINFFLHLIHIRFMYPEDGNIISSKWQSVNLAINISPIFGSRNLMINGEYYSMYMPKWRWGSILDLCGSATSTLTMHPKVCKWKMSNSWPWDKLKRRLLMKSNKAKSN